MKYIKRHKLILEADDTIEVEQNDSTSISELKERLNDLKDEINEYNMKKSKLEDVVMSNTEGKDISKVVSDIIDENRFLTMYHPVVQKMFEIDALEKRIEYYKQLLSEREGDLKLSANLSDAEERQEQADKLNKQIEDIKTKGKDMQDKLKEMQKQVDEEQKDLAEFIKNAEEKFEEDIKKLQIDVEVKQ
jgi:DNA repair exonuclease SbcCD ATPase subunit